MKSKHLVLLLVLIIPAFGVFLLYEKTTRPTRLLWAVQRGDTASVRSFLDGGENIRVADGWNGTPMMYAAADGRTEIIELLLERGADANERARMNRTPLMWAATGGYTETVEFLLKRGARADLRDEDGKTAFDLAEEKEHLKIVQILRSCR